MCAFVRRRRRRTIYAAIYANWYSGVEYALRALKRAVERELATETLGIPMAEARETYTVIGKIEKGYAAGRPVRVERAAERNSS